MNGSTARLSILATVLLAFGIEPAASVAQVPASATDTLLSAARGPGLAAPTALGVTNPFTAPGAGNPATALPSTVDPAIERFVKESGRETPPTAAIPVARRGRAITTHAALNARDALANGSLPAPPAAPPAVPPGGNPASMGLSPLATDMKLKSAPLEETDLQFPINLATALRLSDARPLVVAAAQASVWVAEAQLQRAKVIWVPMAIFGVDFLRHDGGGPDFNKGVMTAPSVNYFEAGPGAVLYFNLTDAYFQPLVARQMLTARHWDTQAAKNDSLQQTADAYFRVHQYRGMYAGALYTVMRGHDLVRKVADLARELVPQVEVDRARNMLADLEQRAVSDRQEWRVASADLTQVLRLDPRAVVVPLEHDHTQITLIDPALSLDDLMPVALINRPELASRQAQILAAETAVRREKMRPLVPLILLGGFQTPAMYTQLGLFGLGPNSSLNNFTYRADVSVQVLWQLEGFGIGNLARIKARRGDESHAIIELRKTQDAVAADVNRALARVQSAAARVLQADRALRTAIITFNGHLEGLSQTRRFENLLVLTFRPQEAVYSLEQLNVSFDEYFTTVADYNRAQFELFHALGYPARELALLRPPGEVLPTNTDRPFYLPPVGNGPPPASR